MHRKQRAPGNMWCFYDLPKRRSRWIEHPARNLAAVPRFIIINPAAQNPEPAVLDAADDELFAEERMPAVEDASNFGLMITPVATCIIRAVATLRSATSRP